MSKTVLCLIILLYACECQSWSQGWTSRGQGQAPQGQGRTHEAKAKVRPSRPSRFRTRRTALKLSFKAELKLCCRRYGAVFHKNSLIMLLWGFKNGCKHVLELMADILNMSSNQQTKLALFRATSK